jgi:hypothetical protein
MTFYGRPKTPTWLVICAIVLSYALFEMIKGVASAQELIVSDSAGPILLGPNPKRFDIGAETVKNLSERLKRRTSRLYLVIDEIQRREPITLFFLVVLTAAPDVTQVFTNEDPVGTFNLFEKYQRFVSFDITERFRNLAAMRDAKLAVLIQPALGLNIGEREILQRKIDKAWITIGRVRFLVQ